MKRFLLLDAHSLIFRAYFAFIKNPLKNSKGQNTSGIYGFLNSIKKIKAKFESDYIVLAFDSPGETFRDKLFKEYKATRPPAPRDIPFQIEKAKEISRFLGIPSFEIPGFEADDILATLTKKLQNYGEVYIVSSDKDLMQLISKNVFVYDAVNDIIYDAERVREKFGVLPERIGDYLSLCGDSIDNIPGVPGIGPHRAIEILKKYADIDEALEKEPKLAEHRETLLLSKRLVVLETEVPIEANPEQLKTRTVDAEGVLKVLSELEFHSFAKEFAEKFHTDKIIRKTEISSAEIKKYAGIHIDGDNVFLSFNENEVYITSMKHAFSIISKPDITKIGYDLKQAIKTGALKSPLFDLKIGAWLIDPNMKNNEFEDICLKYLNCYCEPTPEAISNLSLKLYPVLSKKLEELGEIDLYTKIEEPLIFVLAEMEKRGIGIDIGYLKELRKQIEKDITALADECYRIAGSVFNINSPKQLSHILFEKLKLTPLKKGKSHYSTDFEVLQQLSAKHELPRKILEYRELAKVSSTYIDPLIEFARNSRIHTTFNQTGTATGRLSSNNPNIQNIPIRSHLGNELRKGFVAQKGFLLISADYSQIELRILAHISKDTNLIEAFKTSRDIHNHTASLIFDTGEDNVDEQKRRIAKVVNYGLIYGMSDYGLAQELGISLEQAGQFIQSYYGLYPEVNRWRVSAISSVEQKGYTETLFGRKRPIPEINSDNHNLREFGKRLAINTPIQGTAADLIKLSMIEVEKRLSQAGFKSGLLLSIHDELLFEIEEERISEAGEIIKKAMENVCEFDVPIVVNINIGKNWAEAH